MTTLAGDRPHEPPPPLSPRFILAMVLEAGIVATFTAHHSILGLALCAGYAWFSATWEFFRR